MTKRCRKHVLTFIKTYGANVKGGSVIEHRCLVCGTKVLTNGFTGKRIASIRRRERSC